MPATAADAWKALMDTPGLSTIDVTAFEAAVRVVMDGKTELKDNPMDEIPNDDIDDAMLIEAELADLASKTSEHFAANKLRLDLTGAMTLTVQRANGTFSKVAHIGGEEFKPAEVYLGKKKRLLVKLMPLQAADYSHAEMFIEDAATNLDGWIVATAFPDGSSVGAELAQIKRRTNAIKEQQTNLSKFDDYKDFGTF